ncbi:MAG: transposase [Bacilli bacterium]|nr:transposase [Bacilli bacterium]
MFPRVPGRPPLPTVLCIGEVLFVDRVEGRYPAVLYDWEAREVIDLVMSRQKSWLEDRFAKKPRLELDNVRWFVSDMYDEYARVKRRFLPPPPPQEKPVCAG